MGAKRGVGPDVGLPVGPAAAFRLGGEQPVGNGGQKSSFWGIQIAGTGTTGTLFQGNLIGTDATGTLPLGNGVGILINNGPTDTLIGGSGTA